MDLIIKNGHLLDPANHIDQKGDIAVKDGMILAVKPNLDQVDAPQVLDASECLVTAGLIDIHTHSYVGGTWNGAPADLAGIPMGVTAMVDAGSSGVSNYQGLLRQQSHGTIRGKIMLNISACGIIMPTQFAEPVDPALWDISLFDEAFRRYGDQIIGLKLRASRGVVGALELEPVRRTVELAARYGTRVIVHVTDAPVPMEQVAALLRPGDIFCHVYHGTGHTIFGANGEIEKEILAARERGVLFDVASGRGNFSIEVARNAIARGFLPNTISSDVTLQNWHHPLAGSLPQVMTRFLALGMPLGAIITCVTTAPAAQFGQEGLGCLLAGTPADISVLRIENRQCLFRDKFGKELHAEQSFRPMATVIEGRLLYRSVDLELIQEGKGHG